MAIKFSKINVSSTSKMTSHFIVEDRSGNYDIMANSSILVEVIVSHKL